VKPYLKLLAALLFAAGCSLIARGSGYKDGYSEGETHGWDQAVVAGDARDATMREGGFCKWPQAFYRSINCGALSPDYENPTKNGSQP
jgi:hypothetical protein